MNDSSFGETVSRVVNRVARAEGHEDGVAAAASSGAASGGPLTAAELSHLSLLCTNTTSSSNPPVVSQQPPQQDPQQSQQDLHGFATVEGEQLLALLELLERHINLAAEIHLIPDALEVLQQYDSPSRATASLDKWLRSGAGPGAAKVETLRRGLQAACIILFIATVPGVDRRARNEDAIQASIGLLRHHLRQHLLPALNGTGHLMAAAANNNSNDADDSFASLQSPGSTSRKRRRSSAGNNNSSNTQQSTAAGASKNLKKVYKLLLESTAHWQILLLERLEQLVECLPLDDQQVLMLTNGVLSALEIDSSTSMATSTATIATANSRNGRYNKNHAAASATNAGQQLQLASIAVCTAAFRRYPMHRDSILQDLFPLLLKLPTGKRSKRTFSLRYSTTAGAGPGSTSSSSTTSLGVLNAAAVGQLISLNDNNNNNNNSANAKKLQPPRHISMVTALVLSMVQAAVCRPTYHQQQQQQEEERQQSTTRTTRRTRSKRQRRQQEGNESDDEDDNEEDDDEPSPPQENDVRLESGLAACQAVADSFCVQLLHKCAQTKKSEYRPCLTQIVEDLLMVLLLPEFPAASLLLHRFTARICNEVRSSALGKNNNKTSKKRRSSAGSSNGAVAETSGLEGPYMTVIFDVLGKISAVQSRIVALQQKRQVAVVAHTGDGDDNSSNHANGGDHLGELGEEDTGITLACYCGSNKQGNQALVGCDDCKTFFHGRCVGMADRSSAAMAFCSNGGHWYCDACRLRRIVDRELRKHGPMSASGHDDGNYIVDSSYALRLIFQAFLAHRLDDSNGSSITGREAAAATQFHLARWVDDLEQQCKSKGYGHRQVQKLIGELLEQFWDTTAFSLSSGRTGDEHPQLTEEGCNRNILFLAAKTTPLMLSFRNQISFVVKLTEDNSSHSLRKLSLKTIEKTVEGDPNLMLMPIITKSVSRRLQDEAKSVREAAVSLVGSYVVLSPAVASQFHSSLLACLKDTGISVRKRAVKIFQSILTSNPTYKGRSSVCDLMLQLAADPKEEDAVRDLIDGLFCELWLQQSGDDDDDVESTPELAVSVATAQTTGDSPVSSRATGRNGNNNDRSSSEQGVVTPTPPAPRRHGGRLTQKRSDVAAEQMMEVVRSAGTTIHLSALLKKLLDPSSADANKGRKQNDRIKRQDLDLKHCGKIVGSLFELLISIEEDRETRKNRVGRDLAATLQTIAVFAEVSPDIAEYVFANLDTVLPYLKADNGVASMDEEAFIVAAACDIIYRLAVALEQRVVDRLSSTTVATDLVQITYKFGPFAFSSAIRAFCSLARKSDGIFSKKLLALARTFYIYLFKRTDMVDFSKGDEKIKHNVHRALTVLGLICQYHSCAHSSGDDDDQQNAESSSMWDNEFGADEMALVAPKDLDWSNTMVACFRLFFDFLLKDDSPTRCKSLRALGGIFVSQPRLLLQLDQDGLVEDLMSDEAGVALQLESLGCWCNILEAEEKRIDGGHAKAEMDNNRNITVSKKISGDQDGDATLFGGVLTNHSYRLFEMTKSREPKIRLAVLRVLGLLLRQGLVNPNEAIPHLFALQGDIEHDAIRSLALKLLSSQGEKFPQILNQRISDGVKRAYEFQRAVATQKNRTISATVMSKKGQAECIFSTVFKTCLANKRKQRQGLFKSLLGLFKPTHSTTTSENSSPSSGSASRDEKDVEKDLEKDLALLSFASQILAHLDYSSLDDPLFIVHQISSTITLQGTEILDELAAVLRPVGLASADECDDNNAGEDALERASRSKFPSRTNEARALSSKEFDLDLFVNHCRSGMALCLLLRLKSFLVQIYRLSETRLVEYNPNDSERVSDKGNANAQISKPFDASVPQVLLPRPASKKNKKKKKSSAAAAPPLIDKDALIRQYAEFRRLMRDETSYMEVETMRAGSSGDDDQEQETPDLLESSQNHNQSKRKADEIS